MPGLRGNPVGRCVDPEMGERIFELMIRTASGQPSRSEALGFGEDEIQP